MRRAALILLLLAAPAWAQTGRTTAVPPPGEAGGGSSVVLDLGDDGVNESTGLLELAVIGDPNGIFAEPTADKLLIDVSQAWPQCDAATTVPEAAVTAHEAALSITESQVTDLAHFTPNADPAVDHSGYTASVDAIVATHAAIASAHHVKTINASELTAGTLSAARLPETYCQQDGTDCPADDTGTDDQIAPEVGYTPTTPGDWTDPDPADVGDALDKVAGDPRWTDARAPTAHRDSHETGGSDPLVDLAGETITTGTVADARIAATISRDSEAPAAGDITGSLSAGYQLGADVVGLPELAACAGPGEVVEYGASGVPTCIATPTGGGGGDAITEGDSSVEVVDAGTGQVNFTLDGTLMAHVDSGGDLVFDQTGTISDPQIDLSGNGSAGEGIYSNGTDVFVLVSGVAWRFNNATFGSSTAGRGTILNEAPSATNPTVVPNGSDPDTGMGVTAGGGVALIDESTLVLGADQGQVTIAVAQVNTPASRTCTDSGDGSPGFLAVTTSASSNAEVTQGDPHGCAASLVETGAVQGQVFKVVNVSNAGGTLDFADSSGIQETGAGCSLSLYGTAVFHRISDRWVLMSCIPTN